MYKQAILLPLGTKSDKYIEILLKTTHIQNIYLLHVLEQYVDRLSWQQKETSPLTFSAKNVGLLLICFPLI